MMYEYAELENGTQIAYSDIYADNTVRIEVERPRDWGFDCASCIMPSCSWTNIEGFSEHELAELTDFLLHNSPLIFRFAREGNRTYA